MKPFLAALILCTSLPLFAADAKPNADVLGRWVGGKWPLEGKMLDTDYSKAVTVTGVSNCGWSPDHIFMLCDQSLIEDGKPSRELSVYVFDPENSTFHFYGLSPSGGRPHTSDVVISADGNHWEYQNKGEIKGKPSSSAPSMSFAAPTTSTGGRSIPPTAGRTGSRWAGGRRNGRSN